VGRGWEFVVWSIANEQESETPENEDYLGLLFD
jgi:hypothetical protein